MNINQFIQLIDDMANEEAAKFEGVSKNDDEESCLKACEYIYAISILEHLRRKVVSDLPN